MTEPAPRYGPPDALVSPRYAGVKTFARCPLVDDPEVESIVTAAEAEWSQQDKPADASTRCPRENTKQALVIQMLKRPEGATVAQIMAATGWLNHTVRGTLSGALRKRLGLNVVSAKNPEGVSTYRIA